MLDVKIAKTLAVETKNINYSFSLELNSISSTQQMVSRRATLERVPETFWYVDEMTSLIYLFI